MKRTGQGDYSDCVVRLITHSFTSMSLSKPFRLFDLPLLPLEQVLLLTEPKALLLFALSSEKARQLLGKCSLVKYFDVDVYDTSVIFSICFKSGEPIKWRFTMKPHVNASGENRHVAKIFYGGERTARLFKLDGIRIVLWVTKFDHPDVIRCILPKKHFVDYIRRIGHLFQSICPGQQIRTLGAGKVGLKKEKIFFHMDKNTRCDNFHYNMNDEDNCLEILEKTDVKKNIFLEWNQEVYPNLEWKKIQRISRLHLRYPENLDCSLFLKLENEHLQLIHYSVNRSVLNAYLKKWMNGEFTKRRTLKVLSYPEEGFNDKVWDGLTKEPLETWEELGKPGLVRFSDNCYLNPTPQTAPDEYQTVLLKNCHGQFATVVQTSSTFYFTPWNHPLPPINIPKGHKLRESSESPVVPHKI